MVDVSTTTLKLEVDTTELDRAKRELDLVSRKDVEPMIADALKKYEKRVDHLCKVNRLQYG